MNDEKSTVLRLERIRRIGPPALLETALEGYPLRRGKVRDIYDLGDRLLIIATDRISAFDWVLPTGIPDKGRILTGLSVFWFGQLDCPHHLMSTSVESLPPCWAAQWDALRGRFMVVRKAGVVPIECVVRGYLAGSGWKEYRQSGTVCGIRLPAGLRESQRLPEPIFTPATKAVSGHDENITFQQMADTVGRETADQLRDRSLALYQQAATYAGERGILIADTKLEWGWVDGRLVLVDEVVTPDSSRFWPKDGYRPGGSPPSFDKQYMRDWLEAAGWNKNSPPPALPPEVVARTREKYIEAYERLTGVRFEP